MPVVPQEFKRIVEDETDRLFGRHLSMPTALSSWLFGRVFPGCRVELIESVELHQHRDYRRQCDDRLAFGETDIRTIATVIRKGVRERLAILIENKVDAGQMPEQGKRYQARGKFEKVSQGWHDYACILVGPRSYLDGRYPLGDYSDDGWNHLISYEDLAAVVRLSDAADAKVLLSATAPANSWNKPIPTAVQFWKAYEKYQRQFHPESPVFVKTEKGSRIGGVWPSFYDNQLRNNPSAPRRKRVQIVHMDTNAYVALFIKRIAFPDFENAVAELLEPSMLLAPQGGSWQSIRVGVPAINPLEPIESQAERLDKVFLAAQRMYEFYVRHESRLLAIPTIK